MKKSFVVIFFPIKCIVILDYNNTISATDTEASVRNNAFVCVGAICIPEA